MSIAAGTLDGDTELRITGHIYVSHRAASTRTCPTTASPAATAEAPASCVEFEARAASGWKVPPTRFVNIECGPIHHARATGDDREARR